MKRRNVLAGGAAGLAGVFLPADWSLARGARLTGYLRSNWSRDPFSFGSYSYTPRGGFRGAHRALAEPVAGRIFFAGEAANPDYGSTVHAAYESADYAVAALDEEEHEDIAVIGAGIAGLRVAQLLDDAGYDVTLYEARERVLGDASAHRFAEIPPRYDFFEMPER